MGPYQAQNNIGCKETQPAPCPGPDSISQAQQNCVFAVPDGSGGMQYVWTGDRWQSAKLLDNQKDHDFQ